MSAKERRKGGVIEREIVKLHEEIGVHAERYPLSGSSRFRGQGHDVDVYAFGTDEAPLVGEVKGRKGADGFRLLERWLGDDDMLFLRRDRARPLVVLPWRVWERLLTEIAWLRAHRKPPLAAILEKRAVRADAGGENGETQKDGAGAGIAESGTRPSQTALNPGGQNGEVVGKDSRKLRRAARPAATPQIPTVTADGDAPRPARRVANRQTGA